MKSLSNDTHQFEYWKEKYLDGLDEIERKEKEWGELESLLRHSIARLAVAGYGLNSLLDDKLDRLRNALRRHRDAQQLDKLVHDIADTAARLQDPNQSAYRSPIGVLTKCLDGVEFPKNLRNRVKRFKKQLASADKTGDPKPLVHEFVKLLQQGLEVSVPSPKEHRSDAKAGLLGRFLGAFSASADTVVDPIEDSPKDENFPGAEARILRRILDRSHLPETCEREVEVLRQQIDCEKRSAALEQLTDEVARLLSRWTQRRGEDTAHDDSSPELSLNHVLLELLARLEVPEDMESRVEALREHLSESIGPDQLPAILESIAALVTDIRRDVQRERQEIEQFLKSITDRLVLLDMNLQEAEKSRLESLEDGQDLGNNFKEHVTHLRTSMAEATDIGQLKQAISVGLEAVEQRMETYVLAEERRSHEAEKRIQELGTQLHKVKIRAGSLQAQIQRQRERAGRDGLTGLHNRMAYDERVQQEFVHWKRYHDPLSLMVIDVDHFKRLNDTFGHQAGDKALKILAKQLLINVREADFVARYGGEEFVFIMPKTKRDDAFKVAEKLRKMVEKCGFHYRGEPVSITICCGVAEFREGDTPEAVFQRGDEALYQAKHEGRNRCCLEKLNTSG